MSQIIEYFRSLFNTNNNHNRKRRRVDLFSEEREPLPKYKKVTNIFPKRYSALLDDDADLFQEVKQKKPLYNELLENFLMDRQRNHLRAVLDDGEFSDEEEETFRMPASSFSKRNPPGFNFHTYHQSDSQPSTSANAFQPSRIARLQHLTNGNSNRSKGPPISRNNDENDDDDDDDEVQFVSLSRKPMMQKTTRQELPSLIPISRTIYSSLNSNGHSSSSNNLNSSRPIPTVPVRGRKSILDFAKKNRAFNEPQPRVPNLNSILYHDRSNSRYNELLKSLIPSYSNAASLKQSKVSVSKPTETIDLSDDTENVPTNNLEVPQQSSSSNYNNTSYTGRKSDFNFKKPSAYVDLDDEDDNVDQTQFARSPGLSSTQIIKSNDIDRSTSITDDKKKHLLYCKSFPPVNSLKEKQSIKSSLQEGHLEKLLGRFSQKQAEKNKTIEEEEKNISQLEKERIELERVQQKRIDDQITSALTDKCIIIDEEEDVIDEFPPLTPEQNRLVQFALHGSRNEVIVSKFNMNITRHDLATLDGLNWLNDEVINFYMELIKERSERLTHLPKVHVMNTFFLGKLLQNGHSGVRRWTRKVDIFSFDIIPIPVHVGGVHWCMSIINMRDKTIRYYDSMGHPNHIVLDALEQYLRDESLDKRKIPFDTSDWTLECVADCPQQKNGSDCGVFSCQFAEFISRDSPISFEQQHMPYIRRKMIYEIASGKLLLGE